MSTPHHSSTSNQSHDQSASLSTPKNSNTRVAQALHWFQYISRGGLPLFMSSVSSILLILGMIKPDLTGGLISLSLVYLLYLYSAPIIARPRQPIDPASKLTLPLLWMTSLWVVSALSLPILAELTPITAILFGFILSLTPRYLIPLFFLIFTCLELSLIVAYNLDPWRALYHVFAHVGAAFTLPRLITPEWILRSLYPRILDIEELPLSRRYFDAARFTPSHELTAAPPAQSLSSADHEVEPTFSASHAAIKTPLPQATQNHSSLDQIIHSGTIQDASPAILETLTGLLHQRVVNPDTRGTDELSQLLKEHHDRAASFINRSLSVHLQLLRQQLHVETAVLLWSRPKTAEFEVRAVDSLRDEWKATRFTLHYGILEEARREPLIFNDPIEAHQLVPYYDESLTIGGLMSAPVYLSSSEEAEGILIIDRSSNERWDHMDSATLRIVAEKIALDIETSRLLRHIAVEAIEIDRLCQGLRRLNEVFELDDLAHSIVNTVAHYEGMNSAAYFQLIDSDEMRLSARWINPKIMKTASDQLKQLEVGEHFSSRNGLIAQVVHEGIELSTVIDPAEPREYLSSEDWILSQATEAIALPLYDLQRDEVCAVVLMTGEEDSISPSRFASLRLFFEQVEQKLALSHAHERLRYLALRDGLTNLKNHITFQAEASEMLKRAERDQSPLTFVLLDIDHFKHVNDTYGHPFGDDVLKKVADTLQQEVRDVDLVARYGGEEFAMLLHATSIDEAVISIDRVRRGIEHLSFDFEGREVKITISIGFACYPVDSRSQDRLIDQADKALYQSKRNGRNQFTAWRDIAPEEQDSSVSWTRHPTSVHLSLPHPQEHQQSSGSRPASLLFDLHDLEGPS